MESFLANVGKVIRSESKALVSVGGAALRWKNAWTKLDLDYYLHSSAIELQIAFASAA